MSEAGYFYALSKNTKLTVNFVQIPEKAQISQAMDQINNFEPDMVLLYSYQENIELLMQQVMFSRI